MKTIKENNMTPSELASLIVPWAKSLNDPIFNNRTAYDAIDCIGKPKDVSDALRYLFTQGKIARKKIDGARYAYALIDKAPDDFDVHEIKPVRKKKEESYLHQDEKISVQLSEIPIGIDENGIFTTKCLKLTPDVTGEDEGHTEQPIKIKIPSINEVDKLIMNTPDDPADMGKKLNSQTSLFDINFDKEVQYEPGDLSMIAWMTDEQKIGYLSGLVINYVTNINKKEKVINELYDAQICLAKLIELLDERPD